MKDNSIIDNYSNTDILKKIGDTVNKRGYVNFNGEKRTNNNMVINAVIHKKNDHSEIDSLKLNNITANNVEFFYDSDNLKAIDPLYFKENLNIIETLSGDFDGDGSKDEIAAFIDTGNNSSEILLWKRAKEQGKYFLKFLGSWWKSTNFDATQMKDRLVAGDFTGDGRWDIAGFRRLGTNKAAIEVFMSSSEGKFKPDGHGKKWWRSNNFNADDLTGRLVAGDFDNLPDGKWEIAGFRDLKNNSSEIIVFKYDNIDKNLTAATWWNSDRLDATQMTGKLVAGDFTGDGRCDIAGFRDLKNNSSAIEVFMASAEGKFKPEGHGKKWWKYDNFDATQLTGRLVAADFTNDGKYDDIAALRDLGNNKSAVEVFAASAKGKFNPDEGHGYKWWRSGSENFNANQLIALLDINLHTNEEDSIPDLIGFRKLYNDDNNTDKKYRTIGWYNTNPKFKRTNELGIPWLISVDDTGEIAAKNHAVTETKNENTLSNKKSTKFNVYPNPSSEEITIQFYNTNNGIVQLNINSYTGQLIERILNNQMESGIQTMKLNTAKFSKGMYILELNNAGKKEYQKIILIDK